MKKGDFVRLNYTGRLEDGTIFDTTSAEGSEKPVTICVGEKMLLTGLDEAIVEKGSKKFTVTLQPEKAFGKKDPKMIQVVPTQQLKQQKINPQPGMQLNVDGQFGTILKTGGGRTIVDFNHPLAGKDVTYDIEIVDKVKEPEEQIKALIEPLSIPYTDIKIANNKATIYFEQMLPKSALDIINEHVTKLTKIKEISFEAGK